MQRGTIVKSKAGRDKDTFLIVLETQGKSVLVCDGKKRPLANPKLKKILHVAPTNTVVEEESLLTNNKMKSALRNFKADLISEVSNV